MAHAADATSCSFTLAELPQALRWIAQYDARAPGTTNAVAPSALEDDPDGWVMAAAAHAGYGARFIAAAAAELDGLFASRGPVVFAVRDDPDGRLCLLVPGGRDRVSLIAADGSRVRLSRSDLAERVLRRASAGFGGDLDAVLAEVRSSKRRVEARARMATVILGTEPIVDSWVLRPRAGATFWGQLRQRRVGLDLMMIGAAYMAFSVCSIGAWALIGRATLLGRVDPGYLVGALLAFASAMLFRAMSSRASVDATINFSISLKRWLLGGALRVDVDLVRRKGSAQLLGLVLESGELESLALDGVLLGCLAILDGILALLVLFWSPVGWLSGVWLFVVLAVAAVLAARFMQVQRRWTEQKTELTAELVESLLGQRTRAAQCRVSAWHEREEVHLERYRCASLALDDAAWALRLLGRAGMLGGFVTLAPAIAAGAGPAELAAAVGAIFLAQGALERVTDAVIRLSAARVAFERVQPLFEAGQIQARRELPQEVASHPSLPLLEARDLTFRYGTASGTVLSGASLTIHERQRLLIEAPSGGGKSTLLSILCGLRAPDRGRVYSRGSERSTLGDAAWRARIVSIPQFNQNHMFSGTLAFNCLLGSAWPATPEDVARAQRVLEELGLGPLLATMPGGMEQAVGETGWRLSHGEQARVFLARGLLRGPDVLLIDESFGALDPETTSSCLRHIERARCAVVLVAHR